MTCRRCLFPRGGVSVWLVSAGARALGVSATSRGPWAADGALSGVGGGDRSGLVGSGGGPPPKSGLVSSGVGAAEWLLGARLVRLRWMGPLSPPLSTLVCLRRTVLRLRRACAGAGAGDVGESSAGASASASGSSFTCLAGDVGESLGSSLTFLAGGDVGAVVLRSAAASCSDEFSRTAALMARVASLAWSSVISLASCSDSRSSAPSVWEGELPFFGLGCEEAGALPLGSLLPESLGPILRLAPPSPQEGQR